MSADKIFISNLRLNLLIGTYPEERLQAQPLLLDLELATDMRPAGKSDQLADAIDYSLLVHSLEAWVADTKFNLLEALAEHLAQRLLETFPVSAVRLRLSKPNFIPQAERVGVEIERVKDKLRMEC